MFLPLFRVLNLFSNIMKFNKHNLRNFRINISIVINDKMHSDLSDISDDGYEHPVCAVCLENSNQLWKPEMITGCCHGFHITCFVRYSHEERRKGLAVQCPLCRVVLREFVAPSYITYAQNFGNTGFRGNGNIINYVGGHLSAMDLSFDYYAEEDEMDQELFETDSEFDFDFSSEDEAEDEWDPDYEPIDDTDQSSDHSEGEDDNIEVITIYDSD